MAVTAELARGVTCFRDTCNVYVLRSGPEAVLIDFGAGGVLDHLGELGVERVTDVLLTHHHRDQTQGLARAVAAGARIWAPPFEAELVAGVDRHWQSRQLDTDYELRDDRFSLLEQVPISGTVDEYRSTRFGSFDVLALPTPGHTPGSLTYLVEIDGRKLAFCGDLLYGDGKVWSLAATQWSYSGVEGQAATIVSCKVLAGHAPDLLLPSHGEPVADPPSALARVRARVGELIELRVDQPSGLEDRLANPFEPVTEHLLRNRTTFANSYVLLSETGGALLIDFGHDSAVWRRPLLWSLDGLRVEAVVTTHYHDDHVAGINLLRAVHGCEVWAPANVSPILEDPKHYDLPCLWPDPVPVDRVLPLGEPVRWHEYELTPHPFPGHTMYAAAIAFEADGRRIVAAGDQYAVSGERAILNYQYRNRFRRTDFVMTAELLRLLRPDVIVSGHWFPRDVDDAFLDQILVDGKRLAELHDELLPEESFGDEGVGARIEPYRATVSPGDELELEVTVLNPFAREETASVELVLPDGWRAEPAAADVRLAPHGEATVLFRVRTGTTEVRRARVAAELAVGGVRFGQQAEALVDVR